MLSSCLLVITGSDAGQDPGPPPSALVAGQGESAQTMQRVREEAEASRQRLHSIYVETRAHRRRDGAELRFMAAAKGSKRFIEEIHRPPGADWEEDLDWTRVYLSHEMMQTLWVVNRYCKQSREQPKLSIGRNRRCAYFLEFSGWFPPEDDTPEEDLPKWLLHLALRDPACLVRPELEEVRGHRCVVVELPGQDTAWLDVDRGYALVRRETRECPLRFTYQNADFREVAPKLWLPWELSRTVYYGPGAEKNRDILDGTLTIVRMEVNNVADEVFHFTPEPGTRVYDVDRNEVKQLPGGLEVMDQVARAGRRIVAEDPASVRPASWLGWVHATLLLAAAPAWCLIIFRSGVSRWRGEPVE